MANDNSRNEPCGPCREEISKREGSDNEDAEIGETLPKRFLHATKTTGELLKEEIDAITADVEDFDDAFLEEKAKDILEDIDCRAPNSLGSALHDAFGGFLEEEEAQRRRSLEAANSSIRKNFPIHVEKGKEIVDDKPQNFLRRKESFSQFRQKRSVSRARLGVRRASSIVLSPEDGAEQELPNDMWSSAFEFVDKKSSRASTATEVDIGRAVGMSEQPEGDATLKEDMVRYVGALLSASAVIVHSNSFRGGMLQIISTAVPYAIGILFSNALHTIANPGSTDGQHPWLEFGLYAAFGAIITVFALLLVVIFHMLRHRAINKLIAQDTFSRESLEKLKEHVDTLQSLFGVCTMDGSRGVVGMVMGWSWADTLATFVLALMGSAAHAIIILFAVLAALCCLLGLMAFYVDTLVHSVHGFSRRVMVMLIISFCTLVAKFWTFALSAIIDVVHVEWIQLTLMWVFFVALLIITSVVVMVGRFLIRWSANKYKDTFSRVELGCRVAFQERMLEVTCGFTLGSWGSLTWSTTLEPIRANAKNPFVYFLMTGLIFLITIGCVCLVTYLYSGNYEYATRKQKRLVETFREITLLSAGWIVGEVFVQLLYSFTLLIIGGANWNGAFQLVLALVVTAAAVPMIVLVNQQMFKLNEEEREEEEKKAQEAVGGDGEPLTPLPIFVESGNGVSEDEDNYL